MLLVGRLNTACASGHKSIDSCVSTNASVKHLLGSGGPFAETLPGFQPRAAQITFAETVATAISEGHNLIAEAGTGTGKTLAYLVPALSAGVRTIISTGTRTLQDQLFFRDLPLVRASLGLDIQIALLKGRSNYLCLYRTEQTRTDGRLDSREMVSQLEDVYQWGQTTSSGDLSLSNLLTEGSGLWPKITSTLDNCLGPECPSYDDCFVVNARRNAQDADVVVVNHHLLFADMAVKQSGFGEVLPSSELMILDEAHLVPSIATRFFSKGFSSRQIRDLHRDVMAEAGLVTGGMAVVRESVEAGQIAWRKSQAGFLADMPARGSWDKLSEDASLLEDLGDLAATVKQLRDALKPLEATSVGLESCYQRAGDLWQRWQEICDDKRTDLVSWYERHQHSFSLHSTPLDIAVPFSEYRETMDATWIFTSATLTVKDRFDHFQRETGLQDAHTFIAEGGFDYRSNALLYAPTGLPNPNQPDYTTTLMSTVWPVVEANGGRAFLLFSSHRALNIAADWLEGRCELPLFIQGRAARTALLEEFREAGNGVLLGAASFWEGVDVIGPALSLVMIDKLPFAPPDDPILEARAAIVRNQGDNPFSTLQLPAAVIALKQGAGRLIRDVKDKGVLILGDPRLLEKGYGKVFIESLPRFSRTRVLEKVLAFIEHINPQAQTQKESAKVNETTGN